MDFFFLYFKTITKNWCAGFRDKTFWTRWDRRFRLFELCGRKFHVAPPLLLPRFENAQERNFLLFLHPAKHAFIILVAATARTLLPLVIIVVVLHVDIFVDVVAVARCV